MKRLMILLFTLLASSALLAQQDPAATEEAAMMEANPYVIADTVAYWSFSGEDGQPLAADEAIVQDLSGSGNDLTRVDMESGAPEHLVWSDEHAENMPGAGSIRIFGNNETKIGAYLVTAADAMLNEMTFEDGYTVEAFVKLPEDWNPDLNQWTGVLSRQGTGGDVGKTESDLAEPAGHLAVSNFPEFQWAVWPTNLEATQTNWSDQLTLGEWYHVAIVNDGDTTIMYVNGEEVLRNPDPGQVGIATAGLPWVVGGTHYDNEPNTFNGWIGDIRIVARAIGFDEFLTAAHE